MGTTTTTMHSLTQRQLTCRRHNLVCLLPRPFEQQQAAGVLRLGTPNPRHCPLLPLLQHRAPQAPSPLARCLRPRAHQRWRPPSHLPRRMSQPLCRAHRRCATSSPPPDQPRVVGVMPVPSPVLWTLRVPLQPGARSPSVAAFDSDWGPSCRTTTAYRRRCPCLDCRLRGTSRTTVQVWGQAQVHVVEQELGLGLVLV